MTMTVDAELETLTQQVMTNGRLPYAEAREIARGELAYRRGRAAQAAAAQRERENPPPVHDWGEYDRMNMRMTMQMDRMLDPQRVAWAATERARLEREIEALKQDIANRPDPRLARLQGLVEALGKL